MFNKKIISIFIHCFPPAKGGLEYLVGEIKKILEENYEVHIITGQGLTLDSYKTFSNFTTDNSNNVHRLELNYFSQRLANKFLNKIIFKIGFFSPFYFGPILKYTPEIKDIIAKSDLIIGAGMPTKMFYDAYYFAKKYRKKLICLPAYHNVSYYNHCRFFQEALNYTDKIIYQTNRELSDLSSNYKINNKKVIQLTFNEYSLNNLKNQKEKLLKINQVRKQHFKNKAITIGFVGQITRRKNLTVFKEYLDKYLIYWQKYKYQIKLLLAGVKTNSSGEIENIFSYYIKTGVVKIIYNFENKDEIYNAIDIFINPSHEESLGIVNFEAIYYGIPIIVDKNSAFAEFIPKDSVNLTDKRQLHHQIVKNIKLPNDNYNLLEKYNRSIFTEKLFDLIAVIL